jgi:hypothetical protein
MLDSLMKFGAYKINYFDLGSEMNPKAFGFYIRAEIPAGDAYCRDAKRQLYCGLVTIRAKHEMQNLKAVYLDINTLENLYRPAYVQMKQDILNGLFQRVFVLDERALLGEDNANNEIIMLQKQPRGFELITCKNGECVSVELTSLSTALAV